MRLVKENVKKPMIANIKPKPKASILNVGIMIEVVAIARIVVMG